MSTRGICLLLFLSIAVWGADKEKRFRVEPASTYANKQTSEGLTIAAIPFTSAEQMKSAFGKVNLSEHGVLPILVVMKNDSSKAINLTHVEIDYVHPGGYKVQSTPSGDVRYLEGPKRPNFGGSPIPNPIPRKKKNKLASQEIEGFAFNARMLPAGDSAHGFVYFQCAPRSGSHLYIRGIFEAPTGKELLYFEIPLD